MSSVGPTGTQVPQTNRDPAILDDQFVLRERLKDLLSAPDLLPDTFLSFMVDYLSVNQPAIPISQIFGFQRFTMNSAFVATFEEADSNVYSSLATDGPALTDLPSGTYLVLHGATMATDDAGDQAFQSVSINGAAASDDQACQSGTDVLVSTMMAFVTDLTETTNAMECKYKGQTGTVLYQFMNRFLIAQRVSNL